VVRAVLVAGDDEARSSASTTTCASASVFETLGEGLSVQLSTIARMSPPFCPRRRGGNHVDSASLVRARIVLVLAAVAVVAGCGDEEEQRRIPGTPDPAHAREVARNPYALTCGDLARQPEHPESQKLVIRAEFALAREPVLRERVRRMTLNRAGRSVYWAMTELCKGREQSFKPGRLAVEAVRRGRYLVQPRPEAWNSP
jgi:hypothetical protein